MTRSFSRDARARVARVLAVAAAGALAIGVAPAAHAAAPAAEHSAGVPETQQCIADLSAGASTWTLTVDGVERTVEVYVPESALEGPATPHGLTALFALHGSGNTTDILLQLAELQDSADEQGAVLFVPQGSVPSGGGTWAWNVPGVTDAPEGTPDDEVFIAELASQAVENYCVDEGSIFATGYSGGGRMISAIACDQPGLFAAIAPVVGLRAGVPMQLPDGTWAPDTTTCSPEHGTPVVTFTGTVDPINPSDGGGAAYWQYSADAAVERWGEINGCTKARTTEPAETVSLTTYVGCKSGDVVQSYVIDGAGHTWPGGNAEMLTLYSSVLGPYSGAVDANAVMWDFFRAHA